SRLLTIELGAGDVDVAMLTKCQGAAAAGTYGAAMSAFVQWVARSYEQIHVGRPDAVRALREATAGRGHRRTPTIVADLAWGLWAFLTFAVDAKAVTMQEAADHWAEGWQALREAAARQRGWLEASEPAQRFLELLAAAIASGRAHVAARFGGAPEESENWGW